MTTPAIPHPDKPAVDAAAQAFLDGVAKMRHVPPEKRLRLDELNATDRYTARSWALDVVAPATPFIAGQVARALAAALDEAGEHSAATRIERIAASWGAATVPDDLSGLL